MNISYTEQYEKEVVPYFLNKKKYSNKYKIPCLNKIIVNCGVGKLVTSGKYSEADVIDQISKNIALITGQKPKVNKAKKSIAGFKLREGMPIGMSYSKR